MTFWLTPSVTQTDYPTPPCNLDTNFLASLDARKKRLTHLLLRASRPRRPVEHRRLLLILVTVGQQRVSLCDIILLRARHLPRLGISSLEAQRHTEQYTLDGRSDAVDQPRSPASPSDLQPQREREQEASWHLHRHGHDAQTEHLAELEGGVDLREVLEDGGETGRDAEEVRPLLEVVVVLEHDHERTDQREEEGGDRDGADDPGVALLGDGDVVDGLVDHLLEIGFAGKVDQE